MLKRKHILVLALSCAVATLIPGPAHAGPTSSLTGRVVGLTGAGIDLRVGRQIVHIVLPTPFFAVYNADKTRAQLTDIAPGMTVRVSYMVSARGLQTAREIDILSS